MGTMPRLVERGKKDRRMGAPGGLDWDAIEELDLPNRSSTRIGIVWFPSYGTSPRPGRPKRKAPADTGITRVQFGWVASGIR